MKTQAKKRPRRGGEASGGATASAERRNRRRYTPEERRAALEAWQRSGLNQKEFARTYGISANTIYAWRKALESRGAKGLEHVHPGEVKRRGRRPMPASKREAIEETKRRFPTFGPAKVRQFHARFAGA